MTSSHLALGLALMASAACADFSRGDPPLDAGAGGAAGTDAPAGEAGGAVSFANDVYPLLHATCARCHVAGGEAGDTRLVLAGTAAADAPVVKMFVDTVTPTSSRLLAKASGAGHGGGTIYQAGSPEYETLLRWIQQGATP